MPGTVPYFNEHLEFSSLIPIFSIGSRIGTPSGNLFWTSRTLFHSVFLAWSVRRSLDMNTRMWLMFSTFKLDNKTERTIDVLIWPGRQGWGSARHCVGFSLEMALPDAQLRRMSTTLLVWSSDLGPNLFWDEVYQLSVM